MSPNRNLYCLMMIPFVAACLGGSCDMTMMEPNGGNGGTTTPTTSTLFVVNNGTGVTSYGDPASVNGDVAPVTDLPAGASTQIFQPRGVVVTKDSVLIVSRQNGGLTAHDNALTVTGSTTADRIVEGNATHLSDPISMAYDAVADTLYVDGVPAISI